MKKRLLGILGLIALMLVGHGIAYYIVKIPTQFEVVALVGLAFFYPIVRNPLVGMYCIMIIAPFIPFARRLYYLTYSRPEIDPLIMLSDLLLAFMLMGLFFEFRERAGEDKSIRKYLIAVIVYFVYLALRVVVFNQLALSQAIARFKFYGPPVLFFLIGIVYATRIQHLKRLWGITIGVSVVASLYGFRQLFFGYTKAEQLWFRATDFTSLFIGDIARPFSLFQAPAAFADYCQLGIIGVLLFLVWLKTPLRFVLLGLLPLFFSAILITSVRSSWIGAIASFGCWFVFLKIKGTGRRAGILVGAAAAYMLFESIINAIGGGFSFGTVVQVLTGGLGGSEYVDLLVAERTTAIASPLEEHSFLSRLALWRYLLYLSREPVLALMGRGLGALKADSLYFTYLAEFGYPGVIFIVGILVAFIRRGLRTIDTSASGDVVALAAGVCVMNTIFAIISITGTHIHSFPGDIYFWFWNGAMIKLSSLKLDQNGNGALNENIAHT